MHNDTAYVVVDEPKSLCAIWVALEDIEPGTGELIYYPGSHRFSDFLYGDKRKNWSQTEDGNQLHDHHLFWIHDEAKRRGIPLETFRPKKGDVLFWHADLCHGGGPTPRAPAAAWWCITARCAARRIISSTSSRSAARSCRPRAAAIFHRSSTRYSLAARATEMRR